MALGGGTLVSWINDSVDRVSYDTSGGGGAWTPVAGRLYLAWVGNSATSAGTPTQTGNGITWYQIATILRAGSGFRETLFAAAGDGGSNGNTTVDFAAATQTGCELHIVEYTGADVSTLSTSPGAGKSIVQAPSNQGAAVLSGSVTLAAAESADNRPASCFRHNANELSTERTNWTETGDVNHPSPSSGLESQWRSDAFETTASASWATSSGWVGIACEIKSGLTVVTGVAAIATTGAVASPALVEVHAASATSLSGSLTSAALLEIPAVSSISTTGALTASSLLEVLGQAPISGAGTLASVALVEVLAAAAVTGAGTVSVSSLVEILAAAGITGTCTTVVVGEVPITIVEGVVSIALDGSLETVPILIVISGASLSTDATITVSSLVEVLAAAGVEGASSLSSDALLFIFADASLELDASLTAEFWRVLGQYTVGNEHIFPMWKRGPTPKSW